MGHPLRIKFTCEGLLVYFDNHYNIQGTLSAGAVEYVKYISAER